MSPEGVVNQCATDNIDQQITFSAWSYFIIFHSPLFCTPPPPPLKKVAIQPNKLIDWVNWLKWELYLFLWYISLTVFSFNFRLYPFAQFWNDVYWLAAHSCALRGFILMINVWFITVVPSSVKDSGRFVRLTAVDKGVFSMLVMTA